MSITVHGNSIAITTLYVTHIKLMSLVLHYVCLHHCIPYMAKLLRRKSFAIFQSIAKVFPLNHLLYTVHDGLSLMHHESFPVNSAFWAQQRKFSP